jgi:glucose-like phosphotransferase system IIB component
LNFKNAEHPLYLVPIGAAYFALYYVLFRWCIVRFNLKTPGRDVEELAVDRPSVALPPDASQAARFVAALGGAANLNAVDACTTRLRLSVADAARIDEPALRRLGAAGMVRLSANDVQVVIGPIADQVAGEIRAELAQGAPPRRCLPSRRRDLQWRRSRALLEALWAARATFGRASSRVVACCCDRERRRDGSRGASRTGRAGDWRTRARQRAPAASRSGGTGSRRLGLSPKEDRAGAAGYACADA